MSVNKYLHTMLVHVALPMCLAVPVVAAAGDNDERGISTRHFYSFSDPVDGPRLPPEERFSQSEIANGEVSFRQLRRAGMLMFTTSFNFADGYGDGVHDPDLPDNRTEFSGNRPTLQGNGTFLRVNGLDAQNCNECHTIVSNAVVPAILGVGGVGGISASPLPGTALIDVADGDRDGIAELNGRLINPPFLFGSGGVELVGMEMTEDLQALKRHALDNPGQVVTLETKGIHFGTIVADAAGNLDTSNVEGIEHDLVMRPFGRKGEFATIREFDVGALAFHFGMQSTERFGVGVDQDNDGVVNEVTEGDLSALSIFNTTMNRPFELRLDRRARNGRDLFDSIGCTDCHVAEFNTSTRRLPFKISGEPERPFENTFFEVDLSHRPARFRRNRQGGIEVRVFSDFKRHDMGDALAETSDLQSPELNREFITARLWGVADTAPYLHDGRALTLREAILFHDNPGSEASQQAQNFAALSASDQADLLRFLGSLRTPVNPNSDVVPRRRTF